MKTLLFSLFVVSPTVFAHDLFDYAVFSKTDINSYRSDFEGRTGAGGSITTVDFLFTNARSGENGVMAGKNYTQVNGGLNASEVLISSTTKMTAVAAFGNPNMKLTTVKAYLNSINLPGTVEALQYEVHTSFVGRKKKLSDRRMEEMKSEIHAEVEKQIKAMDDMSYECGKLEGKAAEVVDNKLIIKATEEGLNVFNLSEAEFYVGEIQFVARKGQQILLNIDAPRIILREKGISFRGDIEADSILWNFKDAESLTIQNTGSAQRYDGRALGVPGSILAPNAVVKFLDAAITGSLWVKEVSSMDKTSNGGQVNYLRYRGVDCRPTPTDRPRGGKG